MGFLRLAAPTLQLVLLAAASCVSGMAEAIIMSRISVVTGANKGKSSERDREATYKTSKFFAATLRTSTLLLYVQQ